jgi:hypothetical protein
MHVDLGPMTTCTYLRRACIPTSWPNLCLKSVFRVDARAVELGKQAVPVSSRCDFAPRTPLMESLTLSEGMSSRLTPLVEVNEAPDSRDTFSSSVKNGGRAVYGVSVQLLCSICDVTGLSRTGRSISLCVRSCGTVVST